ncbi:MAG: YceI family protein [Bacteroidia bacterium]
MKKIIVAFMAVLTVGITSVNAQGKFFTRNGYIKFYSEATMENIEAHNRQVTSFLDTETGEFAFSVLMKSFQFEKALMQEHFNENYVESDKYPKSTFKGKISNPEVINYKKDGVYNVQVDGDLTIHGVTKKVSTDGTIEVNGGKIIAKSKFPVAVADYNISIPAVVRDNIAKEVEVTVEMAYEPYKQQ